MPGRHHVLLVPGFFGFASLGDFAYFGHVKDFLAEVGPEVGLDGEIRVVPTPPTASLRVRAARLVDTIAELPEGDHVSLVGHSSGGLDARLAVTPQVDLPARSDAERCTARVRSVLTVATPHHGTPVAHLFNSFLGQELLRLLSVFTIAALRAGRLPIGLVLRAAALFRRQKAPGGVPAQLVSELLGGFTRERRRELQAFLSSLGADQDLLGQLTPGAMDLFNASTGDRPGLRIGCLVARARPPGLRSALSAGFDPYAHATHALFVGLYRIAARTDPAKAARLAPEQRLALRRALGRSTDARANDGMVPTLSQVWGEVVGAAWADHHDLIGHFDAPGHVPPHFDWLTSGSGFDRERFEALWRAAARWLASGRAEEEAPQGRA
jgi:triacylglycerol lipase